MKTLLLAALGSMLVSLSFGQDMVKIPGGTFWMGLGTSKDLTYWPHPVTLSPFCISKFETTYETWTKVRDWGVLHGYTDLGHGLNGCAGDGTDVRLPSTTGANNPVTCVYWYDAVKWCNARSEMENLNPVYFTDNTLTTVYRTGQLMLNPDAVKWTANGYRLPTEAEWEFCARGGNNSNNYTYSGSNTLDDVAWYNLNSATTTHPVGQRAPNELGLYDMTGNVAEMCWDWYRPYDTTAQVDPRGQTVKYPALYHRVQRGGSYIASPLSCPSTQIGTGYIPSENNWWGWIGFRCVGPEPKLTITNPASQEVVLADSRYSIRWHTTTVDSIKFAYSIDDGATFTEITRGIPAGVDSFAWHVPDTISSKCVVMISNLGNPLDTTRSSSFRIKGYVLTRLSPNGDYEAFTPQLHGWQFKNCKADMFPDSVAKQFNYDGNDPYTGKPYNNDFYAYTIGLVDSDFVDWPLFVRTFGVDSCYKSIAKAVYSPLAVRFWSHFKDYGFKGSCFGFAISSILAFEQPTELLQRFPEIGSFQNLHDLPLDSLHRRVVNQIYEHQFGSPAWQMYAKDYHSYTPTMTLDELKNSLLSESPAHRTLSIADGSGGGAHAITPYCMKRDGATGLWNVYVYDSNCITADCQSVVIIDSLHNSWQFPNLGWANVGKGLWLHPDPRAYIGQPGLWDAPEITVKTTSVQPLHVLAASYARLFNSDAAITITNAFGETAGFHDGSSFNGISDGMPIIPATGSYHRPIGYYVPSGVYTVRMSGFAGSDAVFSAFDNYRVFTCWRTGADKSQIDLLTYDNGLAVGNPDPQTKSVNLECIAKVGGAERVFRVQNCPTVHNDSLGITAPDADRLKFVNRGPQKTYDLNIRLAGSDGLARFTHAAVTIPANSSHYILPNWPNLLNQPVQIYEDIGNTGTIHDTLTLANQITAVRHQLTLGTPQEFRLEQNYPNPFNPSTTIRYGLPIRSQVTLTVFNMLGQQVALLQNGEMEAGYHEAQFDGKSLSSGVYFYRINAGDFVQTRKMMLVK